MAYQRLKCLIFSFLLTTGNSQIEPEPFDHETSQFVSMGYVLKPMRAVRIFSDTAHLFFPLYPSTTSTTTRGCNLLQS